MQKCILLEVHVNVENVGWVLFKKYDQPTYCQFPPFHLPRVEHINGTHEYWVYDLHGVTDYFKIKYRVRNTD